MSELVQLLRPHAAFANILSGKGDWAVRYTEYGLPSFCIMLAGSALLAVDGERAITISAGDFVLLKATPAFTFSSFGTAPPVLLDPHQVGAQHADLRYGDPHGEPEMRSLGGAFVFDCDDAGLLLSSLPRMVHVRNSARLAMLVQMVKEESSAQQAGNQFMLSHLAGMLLVEAMRCASAGNAPPGLLRGLGDDRIAPALKQLHANVGHGWSVGQLASIAALSRSAFFERFTRLVGSAPMEYLLLLRMHVAKTLLRANELSVAVIAERVGYGSTSAFSAAFSRHVGMAPSQYLRQAGP
ncbi:AraC-like DNA-binding protein [Duganella sp. 1224]|uniref:AraC family transcriptional regulator n=1 Tax=Duganella sp. 1224 TaxID=2587052 RepID=UPI0017F6639D|nr:AraC family transcriptional regulator [Duganella sp. 1224]NYE59941.1 AraC-like DNA-binding protein [Duganella sp. 1224]